MISNKEFLESLGPGGYPGEPDYIIDIDENTQFSPVSGYVTVSEEFNWESVPQLYRNLSTTWNNRTWIPMYFNEQDKGTVFAEMAGSRSIVWMAIPSKIGSDGKFTTDSSKAKIFKQTEYLDAVSYILGQ